MKRGCERLCCGVAVLSGLKKKVTKNTDIFYTTYYFTNARRTTNQKEELRADIIT